MKKLYASIALVLAALAFSPSIVEGMGNLRFRSGGPSASQPAPPSDTTPDAFTIVDVTNQPLSTLTVSQSFTPLGYNAQTTWSISGTGCTMSANGGAYGTSGNISPTQSATARTTTSGSNSTAVSCVVTVGGTQDTWSLTTLAAPPGSCTTAEQQLVCFFNAGSPTLVSTSGQASQGGIYTGLNAMRNSTIPMNNYTVCGGSPQYNYTNGGANMAIYEPIMEAYINYIRGGTDNRTNANCFYSYWMPSVISSDYFMQEPKYDSKTWFVLCKLGLATATYTASQVCAHSRSVADKATVWWRAGNCPASDPDGVWTKCRELGYASGRIHSHVLESMIYCYNLGCPAGVGETHPGTWRQRADDWKNIILRNFTQSDAQAASGATGFYTIDGRNDSMQVFQMGMIADALWLYYDNVEADPAIPLVINRMADVVMKSAVMKSAARGYTTNTYSLIYNYPNFTNSDTASCWDAANGTCGEIGPLVALNGFWLRPLGRLYRYTCDPTWKDRLDRMATPMADTSNWWYNGGLGTPSVKERLEINAHFWRASTDRTWACGSPPSTRPYATTGAESTMSGTSTLTLTPPAFSGCPSACTTEYQWMYFRDGTNASTSGWRVIAGQTSSTYAISGMSGNYVWGAARSCVNGYTPGGQDEMDKCSPWAASATWSTRQ